MTISKPPGSVYVVATPIGNLEDLSPRARRLLSECDVIACEDTRRTGKLCAYFGIGTPRISLHVGNEQHRVPSLLSRLEAGESIALVSDAGTPLVSDPGARLVDAAIERDFAVVPVPGPSAVLAALVASGLRARPFTFAGFLPRKGSERGRWLDELSRLPGAIVLFEAPGRVRATLEDLHRVFGARRVAVARELTKKFEQMQRGTLGEFEIEEPRGEVTLVIEGPEDRAVALPDAASLDREIDALLDDGQSARDVSRALVERHGLRRSEVYERVLVRAAARDR